MAVKKIKWKELMTNLGADTEFDKFLTDLENVDTKLNTSLNYSYSVLKALLGEIDNNILTSNNTGYWAELDIWLSSFRENDKRFILLLSSKLREYLGFYLKVLTDAGVQRNLIYSKTYTNNGSASSTERGTDSVTPQNSNLYDSEHPESDSLFDQAIANYASEINKNKAQSTTSSYGGSTTGVTGVTWDEQKKNLQMLFYNELKDYIMSIPERIYNYYALETIPAPDLFKRMVDNFHEVIDNLIPHE